MAINDLYDMSAFSSYLTERQGAGLVPEFTNRPGQPGFFVNDVAPQAVLEDDSGVEELPDIDSYLTSGEAKGARNKILKRTEDKRFNRKKELEGSLGITKLRSDITSWKAQGLGGSSDLIAKEELLKRQETELISTLSLEEATEDRLKERQYLRDLETKIGELPSERALVREDLASSRFEAAEEQRAITNTRLEEAALQRQNNRDQDRLDRLSKEVASQENRESILAITLRREERLQAQAILQEEIANRKILAKEKTRLDRRELEIKKMEQTEERDAALLALKQNKFAYKQDQTALELGINTRLAEEKLDIQQQKVLIQKAKLGIAATTNANMLIRERRRITSVAAKYGLGNEELERIEAVFEGDLTEEVLKRLHPDTGKVLFKERTETRILNAQDIAVDFEGHIPFFIAETQTKMPEEQLGIIEKEVYRLQKEVQKAKGNAPKPSETDISRLGSTEARKDVVSSSINRALVQFDKQFKKDYLSLVPLSSMDNFTELERQVLAHPTLGRRIEAYLEVALNPEVSASSKYAEFAGLSFDSTWSEIIFEGFTRSPATSNVIRNKDQIRSIFKKVATKSMQNFNALWGDTMGVRVIEDDLITLLGGV